jgi:hypothetical protein
MPARPEIDALGYSELIPGHSETLEATAAANINLDDVKGDPQLALFEALPPGRRFDNETDLDDTAKEALAQWRSQRPKKTTAAYAKCRRLWKVSVLRSS